MNRLIESRPETPEKWEDWPDKAIELRLSVSSVAGRASAMRWLADDLSDAAAAKFAAGEDELAHFIRDELIPRLEKIERNHRDKQVRLHKQMAEVFADHDPQEEADDGG